jgi:hypothetical protein
MPRLRGEPAILERGERLKDVRLLVASADADARTPVG